ncbi:MAG: phytanoyl-CoA dioxygenase family protein [Rhodobacter sp.]|nr:phytanoyl-CoA dioxygenase family protein [Rhodobacter sp.]
MSDIKRLFDEQGFYLAKGVFKPDQVAALERDFDRIVAQLLASGETVDATWDGGQAAKLARASDVILHTHNVQKYSRTWLNAFLGDRFLDVAEAILGPDIVLHHSKLFQKPSETGSPFPMHQDWPYFPTVHDSMIAGIIHVSDATDAMGCLRVYPGSHRLGRIEGADGRRENAVLDRYPIEEATVIEAEAGDVVFFHYFTLHGSMPNRSERVRKTVLCQLYAGTDRVEDGNRHPDERMVLRGWNHNISRAAAGEAA